MKTTKDPKFNNKNGTLTSYSFICGYVEEYGDSDFPRAAISKENDYHVKGFDRDEKHFWKTFETVKEARSFARKQAGKLTTK